MSLLLVLLVVAGCAVPQEQLRMTQPQARQENELTIVSPRLHSHHPTFRVQCVNSEPLCRQRLAEFETLYQQFGEEINIVRETINHNTFQTSLPQQVTAQETIDQYFSTGCSQFPSRVVLDDRDEVLQSNCGSQYSLEDLQEVLETLSE